MSNNILNERRTENVMDHSVLQDSEFDDALDVPDSLEITVNENDDTITVECGGDANSIGMDILLGQLKNDINISKTCIIN